MSSRPQRILPVAVAVIAMAVLLSSAASAGSKTAKVYVSGSVVRHCSVVTTGHGTTVDCGEGASRSSSSAAAVSASAIQPLLVTDPRTGITTINF
jgi:type 1 fimbria pilin